MRAWLLAVLLLSAQAVGLAHRVNHTLQPGSFARTAAQLQQLQPSQKLKLAGFGGEHQAGSADCRLIDQLTHVDALCAGPAVVAALLQPAERSAVPQASAPHAAAAAPYLARAPPRG
jgi:hypothetical protein